MKKLGTKKWRENGTTSASLFAANFFTTFLILAHPYFHALLVFAACVHRAGRKFISPRAFCIPVRFRTTPHTALRAAGPASLWAWKFFSHFFSDPDTSAFAFLKGQVSMHD
jgi:hypothetical protein